MKSVLACISKVIFLMVAGNIVKRYSELPKTITLTLNHILQLGFCRSLTCSTAGNMFISISHGVSKEDIMWVPSFSSLP